MKKFIALILVFSFSLPSFAGSYIDKQLKEAKKNQKYQSVKIHTQTLDDIKISTTNPAITNITIKDPKLIKLSDITPIDENLYKQKLKADEKTYEKEIKPIIGKKLSNSTAEPIAADLYRIYRITEKLIRANNLEHMNWRIALVKDTKTVNAFATDANLIAIYTALYDSVYENDEALAMVIAHEMSHNLLGHLQRQAEMIVKYNNYANFVTFSGSRKPGLLTASGAIAYKKHLFNEIRMMEFMADTEGLNLVIKAGYDPEKAIYTLKFLDALPHVKAIFETHPIAPERLKSAKENILMANPCWVEEGKYNIYNSNVLPVKRSSDKISIVISSDNTIKNYYQPETLEEKLTRLAYVSYTKGDMKNAIKYFKKLSEISNDYTIYLYLSYANEYLYKQTKEKSYLTKAKENAKKASELNKNSEIVKEQLTETINL